MLVLGLVSTSFAFNGAHQGNGGLIALGLANYQTTNLGNTWINPAAINAYKNKAYGFLGSASVQAPFDIPDVNKGNGNAGRDAMAGAHFDTPAGVLGIWINRGGTTSIQSSVTDIGSMDAAVDGNSMEGLLEYKAGAMRTGVSGLSPYQEDNAAAGGDNDGECEAGETCKRVGLSTPGNNLDLFYGRDLGAALIGVRINYNSSSDEFIGEASTTAQPFGNLAGQTPDRDTVDELSDTVKTRDIGLHFGVAMKEMPINASLLIGLPSASEELVLEDSNANDSAGLNGVADTTQTIAIDETIESDGAMNIGLYVNGALKMSDTTTLVPTLFIEKTKNSSTMDSSYTDTTVTGDGLPVATSTTVFESEASREGTGFVFGVDGALNMKPNDKTLVIAGLGLTYLKSDLEVENEIVASTTSAGGVTTYNDVYGPTDENATVESSTIAIPFVVGVQNKTWKTVTTRLGMKANIWQRTKTTTTETEHYATVATPGQSAEDMEIEIEETSSGSINNGNPVTVSMGFSVKLGEKMGLTAVLNEDILFGGGYLVSGLPDTLNTIVSVGYSW
jgi:hypothetical protein